MLSSCQHQALADLCHLQQLLSELSCLVELCLLADFGAAHIRGPQQLYMLKALLDAAAADQLSPYMDQAVYHLPP